MNCQFSTALSAEEQATLCIGLAQFLDHRDQVSTEPLRAGHAGWGC